MVEPPLLSGAFHERLIRLSPTADALRFLGAVGTVMLAVGVPFTSADGVPSLAPVLVAMTLTVYSVPFCRLLMVRVVVEPEEIVAWRLEV